jgi:epoxyqueuosine reductase
MLDSTKCLSYLTIEVKGAIPEALRPELGAHVYGCDICQEVCPWNATAARSDDASWLPRTAWNRPRLGDLWRSSDAELRRALKGSAMKRAGLKRLRRNVAVALANTGAPPLDTPQDGPSAQDPLVEEHLDRARSRGA